MCVWGGEGVRRGMGWEDHELGKMETTSEQKPNKPGRGPAQCAGACAPGDAMTMAAGVVLEGLRG